MENGLEKIQSNSVTTAIYDRLLTLLRSIGPFEVEVKKTSLHILNNRAFLGVHPRSNGLLLNIVTETPITSTRIKKSEQVSANRCHNEIVITSPDELNDELVSWIENAYSLTVK